AIVSNAGGAGVLAADACADSGLSVGALSAATQRRLATLLPPAAAITRPGDTTPGVRGEVFKACLGEVAAHDAVDALLALGRPPTAMADRTPSTPTARVTKPLAAALLDRPDSVALLDREVLSPDKHARRRGRIPVYSFPESAARALAHAASYREWRDARHGQ